MSQALFSCPDTFYRHFDRKGGQQWTTHYCPGCGHGLIHKYVAQAIDDLGVQDRAIFVSPVGCAVFGYYYFDVGNVQVAHGRCPAAATALKRAHPDSIVLGYQGDGDLAAIGTAEIIHAANRGENISIFFVNNAIYGMTGGQLAPTSVMGMQTATTPDGRSSTNEGFPMRVCEMLATLDAPYYLERVAVGDPKHNAKALKAIKKAMRYQIENKGFSLVEILSPCPTGWKKDPVEAAHCTVDVLSETFPLGIYRDGHEHELGHPRYRREIGIEDIPAAIGIAESAPPRMLDDHLQPVTIKAAGFGGQGVLALGLVLSKAGMLEGRHVSWMPSYGPEMRGGTANCSVTISGEEIGSPLVTEPDILVAMNSPSVEKFASTVRAGGLLVLNASMIPEPPKDIAEGVEVVMVRANEISDRIGSPKVTNAVALGALLKARPIVSVESALAALPAALKIHDEERIGWNRDALEAGAREAVTLTPA